MAKPLALGARHRGGSSPIRGTNTKLGSLVITVLTMVSKSQESSKKRQMGSPQLSIFLNWGYHIEAIVEHCKCSPSGSEVRVLLPPPCNDSEMNDGTDAKNEMETFEARLKE